ncbi:amino acid ABC transporter substrate-binding protein [Spartinivicinus ruber]|uniref:amino acid ABC transporter substrate-binding protein n=1 Tax=Spartinivicinus ruber TaxID=2683272 RepID=UPI0013D6AC75|nr:amino acid ABC transporter substrate-binding protein [Spartinivicinus ruber]
MKLKPIFILALLYLVGTTSVFAAIDITHPVLRKGSDLDAYASRLLVFLVEKSGETANMKPYRSVVNAQDRKVDLLKKGELSVDWLGASKSLEEGLLPIRFPVFRGLLGHRIFITNKTMAAKLGDIKTKADLDKLTMIQGQGWADVDVLKSGGFKVKEVANFESIFKLVNGGRVDLFPRAVIEPYSEVASRVDKLPDLVVDDKLMVVYKFPMFFFVSPAAKPLADALTNGFKKAYEDGSFIKFFESDPLVKSTFEKVKMDQRMVFNIDNPHLSEETKAIDDQYWMKTK